MGVAMRWAWLGLLLAASAGCIPRPGVTPEQLRTLETGLLAFVQDGRTTREEALLKLGAPLARLEADRILIWDFQPLSDGSWVSIPSSGGLDWQVPALGGARTCSLVLVFDDKGVLLRHSKVRLDQRPPEAKEAVP
jgi:hypothetical protein